MSLRLLNVTIKAIDATRMYHLLVRDIKQTYYQSQDSEHIVCPFPVAFAPMIAITTAR